MNMIIMIVLGATVSLAQDAQDAMRQMLDAPLLFTKHHSYTGIHIYDTCYKWPPGGGGIYVLENPSEAKETWRIRPVIDEGTPGTLGVGVYNHPELSWDAKKVIFCFKGEPEGSTSIYEIGIDGRGLRRITDPAPSCDLYKGKFKGQHDFAPAYLPDGRIVFLSTRASGLVPCNNTGVAILHVMNADGSGIRPISVNNVNEFDPSILPDGRILFGRWEYVDKNALTIQSLWTMNPDGTQETAFYANNMVFPEAILDARAVPGTHLIVGALTKHNAPPYGSIAFIDPRVGKNDPKAITNLENPDQPTYDKGASCEPWPLSSNVVIFSGRPQGAKRNCIEMMNRRGDRFTLLSDPDICLHSPMLVKPRRVPPVLPDTTDPSAKTGRFFVQDIYNGMDGVARGEVKWLRVLEETSRVSGSKMGGSPFNQTFLVSAALAFGAKIYHGIVPVDASGSAYFEAPSGRALYLQALDAEGRMLRSMRTFVQAAPGTIRSCIGCHEPKYGTPINMAAAREYLRKPPLKLKTESWGTGYMDYPTMVQPVLDKHCVSCHGGPKGIAAGLDLSGGWTEFFNISYENLANRNLTQLTAHYISGIDCMNGTALWSSQIFPARAHGSGAAPLAALLVSGHEDRIPNLTRTERDLLLAWIDSNGLYHGSWDQTAAGCRTAGWSNVVASLKMQMKDAGCMKCHSSYFENDWINLRDPQMSRILRAPLAGDLSFCRNREVTTERQRIRLLWNRYAHAVQPPEMFAKRELVRPDRSGEAVISFTSTNDPVYAKMLATIQQARAAVLANPRVDMPGAEIEPGQSRIFIPPPLPDGVKLEARVNNNGAVLLTWERSARTIGVEAEIHRDGALLAQTAAGRFTDTEPPAGKHDYTLIFVSGADRSQPSHASVTVPAASANDVVRYNGHGTLPHCKTFDLTHPLTVECRVKLEKPGKMPVVVSCGAWGGAGWFLQAIGGKWRWYAGGVVCDGGKVALNQWTHLRATSDGKTLRLYQDGQLVAEKAGDIKTDRWPGALHVGQYGASPGPNYEVHGQITDVIISSRD